MGQSLFITWESEDFLGNHMVSGGNQGEGGGGRLLYQEGELREN